ncbi:hypothetical protein UGYR_02475 [Yersinia ruckeri]|nr:hypothetical protein UGYR_02475 [Yersinia ruckeri]
MKVNLFIDRRKGKGRLRGQYHFLKINQLHEKQSLTCVPLRDKTYYRVGDLGHLWITATHTLRL